MAKMSVTRALVELKSIDAKIQKAMSESLFVTTTVGRGPAMKIVSKTNATIDETKKLIQSSYDRINSLLANRRALKSAIVSSNASTYVSVCGVSYTVAEAIELKSSVSLQDAYVAAMRSQFATMTADVEKANVALNASIETLLSKVYENEKGKVDDAMYAQVAKPQLDAKERALYDPMKIETQIEKNAAFTEAVHKELDFLLSESNASTVIEVDLTA